MVLNLTERHGQHQSLVRAMMWKLYTWKEENDSNTFHSSFIRMRATRLCYQAQATIAPEPTSEVEGWRNKAQLQNVLNTWGRNFDSMDN